MKKKVTQNPLLTSRPWKRNKLVNSDAIASVAQVEKASSDNFFNQEHGSRYSKDNITHLMNSQMATNKNVSDYIKRTDSKEIVKDNLPDEEFDQSEIDRMQKIKDIRHRKKIIESGLAMNTKKEEFLAPKDVCMAEEDMNDLKNGIENNDFYTINTSKDQEVIDDYGDGENWIDNQLNNALGTSSKADNELIAVYNSSSNTTDFIDTSEMRAIKVSMNQEVEDYTTTLELEILRVQKSIKRNKETLESVKKGILSHEKDIEDSSKVITEKAPKFKTLMEFTDLLEDVGDMLDSTDDEINNIFDNFKETERQFRNDVSNAIKNDMQVDIPVPIFPNAKRGLGFKANKQPPQTKSTASNTLKLLEQEFSKDIEAARNAWNDVFKKVNSEFHTPILIYETIIDLYSQYGSHSGFPFEFDIHDMIDYVLPYIKLDVILNFDFTNADAYMKDNKLSDSDNTNEMEVEMLAQKRIFIKSSLEMKSIHNYLSQTPVPGAEILDFSVFYTQWVQILTEKQAVGELHHLDKFKTQLINILWYGQTQDE